MTWLKGAVEQHPPGMQPFRIRHYIQFLHTVCVHQPLPQHPKLVVPFTFYIPTEPCLTALHTDSQGAGHITTAARDKSKQDVNINKHKCCYLIDIKASLSVLKAPIKIYIIIIVIRN